MSKRYLITGGGGQLGKALSAKYPHATALDRKSLDISNIEQVRDVDWSKYDVIINAAAYVNADQSETIEGRRMAWLVNAVGPRNLVEVALKYNLHMIHVSSEYVFDGTIQNHAEDESFTPLSVYGQSKAAGDIAVRLLPNHHILRTSWVVGDGHNFVKTMKRLADMRVDPRVVNDQFGRLTFTSELVRAIDHIITDSVEPGTYNLSNSGKIRSWADIATLTFELSGHHPDRVTHISTEEYKSDKKDFAPRPSHSALSLEKIQKTGFQSIDYEPLLKRYISDLGTA